REAARLVSVAAGPEVDEARPLDRGQLVVRPLEWNALEAEEAGGDEQVPNLDDGAEAEERADLLRAHRQPVVVRHGRQRRGGRPPRVRAGHAWPLARVAGGVSVVLHRGVPRVEAPAKATSPPMVGKDEAAGGPRWWPCREDAPDRSRPAP